jgi:hypothetical protein
LTFPTTTWVIAFAFASVGNVGAIDLRHEPVECVSVGSFSRIAATASPAAQVARAEIHFRVAGTGGWYSVIMSAEEANWIGYLPRPAAPLDRFEYRIVATATDLSVTETPIVMVRVPPVGTRCEDESGPSTEVSAPIVIRVPAGSPVMPPVPPGFSPAGAVAAAEPLPKTSGKSKIVTLGALAGGLAVGVIAASAGSPSIPADSGPPPLVPPEFSTFGFTPLPDSVISPTRGGVSVTVRVTGAVGVPLNLTWLLELRSNTALCLVMAGETAVGGTRPENVLLAAPLSSTDSCASGTVIEQAVLTIQIGGEVVYGTSLTRRFYLEP